MLFQGGSGFTVLRCTSFALESCARPDRRYSLADLLKYNFYLPFFFFGPIMTFDRFHAQVRGRPGPPAGLTPSPDGGSVSDGRLGRAAALSSAWLPPRTPDRDRRMGACLLPHRTLPLLKGGSSGRP